MTKTAKRRVFARGSGIMNATGPQARFIVFLIFLLIGYTLLLRIYQKLAAIVDLPVFLPIALVTLLAYIGVSGSLYSHTFVGPLARIRKTLDQLADGDRSVTIRLRNSDDPVLKDLVSAISRLCQNSRQARSQVQAAARSLLQDIDTLDAGLRQGAQAQEVAARMEALRAKHASLEQAIEAMMK